MTTTDTRAALDAAIRTFGLGAYSPGEPSAPDSLAAAQIWIEIEAYGHAAPLRAAITAHVEAEVARRLAVAPIVEEAIEAHGDACYERGHVHAGGLPDDSVRSIDRDAAEATLRAAIAADRERAVLGARLSRVAALRLVDAHGDSIRRTERASSRIGTTNAGEPVTEQMVTEQINARAAVIDALTGGEDAPARPTPDEARRLVDEYGNACCAALPAIEAGARGDGDAIDAMTAVIDRGNKARTALLRALGVEA